MLKGYKAFIARGNVIDLAIGVVIGTAFGKITTSLVSDIINPLLGPVVGRVQFSNLFVALSTSHFETLAEAKEAGVPVITYGVFLDAVLQFLIVGFALYVVVQQVNRLNPPAPPPPATTRACPFCLGSIPQAATRCQHCTSQLDAVKAA
jgi:large conductance mechanosensitive channel